MCSKKRNEQKTNEFNMDEYFRNLKEKEAERRELDDSLKRELTSLELPN